jgi:hypothetical protein
MNKKNIFDFATTELSHSAFFAWLICQTDPSSDYSTAVREQGLSVVNTCLKSHNIDPIEKLEDIESTIVERESFHIDITVFIKTKTGRNVGIIIENKIGAHESRKNQLMDYYSSGKKWITEQSKGKPTEEAFVYLKSDYDFEDPLVRKDDNNNLITLKFKKIDWQKIYHLFKDNIHSDDSIIRSYACWITKKYQSILNHLDVNRLLSGNDGRDLLKSHIGQVTLIKSIFDKLFKDYKRPCCREKDKNGYLRFYYQKDYPFFKLGTDKGSPWSELWLSEMSDSHYYYRLQINAQGPLLHARLYGGTEEKRKYFREEYEKLIDKHGLSEFKANLRPSNIKYYAYTMFSFVLLEKSIEELRKIEDVNNDFLLIFR